MVAANLPVPWSVALDKADSRQPLGALPKVQLGDQRAHGRAVSPGQRVAVVAVGNQRVVGEGLLEADVGRVAVGRLEDHVAHRRARPGPLSEVGDPHPGPQRAEPRPAGDAVDIELELALGHGQQLGKVELKGGLDGPVHAQAIARLAGAASATAHGLEVVDDLLPRRQAGTAVGQALASGSLSLFVVGQQVVGAEGRDHRADARQPQKATSVLAAASFQGSRSHRGSRTTYAARRGRLQPRTRRAYFAAPCLDAGASECVHRGGLARIRADNRRLAARAQPALQRPRPTLDFTAGDGELRSRTGPGPVERAPMTETTLDATAQALVAPNKGILAADESFPTIAKRFAAIGVDSSEAVRRDYRGMLFTTAGIEAFISGVIMFHETLGQAVDDGRSFPEALRSRGIHSGIKVDTGAKPLALCPGEKVTEGLDGLRDRLLGYREQGATFAKWRAVITIGEGLPSPTCLRTNAHALARYAALCQEAGLVPIVEPEVLMDGSHDIDRCDEVTSAALHEVFAALFEQRVRLEGMLLKPNMVIAGKACPQQAGIDEVAARTVACLRRHVPAAVPGIVFLSGGQDEVTATAHLNAMNRLDAGELPWELSFSYGRALQQPALQAWGGKAEQRSAGQEAFFKRAKANAAARNGRWDEGFEKTG